MIIYQLTPVSKGAMATCIEIVIKIEKIEFQINHLVAYVPKKPQNSRYTDLDNIVLFMILVAGAIRHCVSTENEYNVWYNG